MTRKPFKPWIGALVAAAAVLAACGGGGGGGSGGIDGTGGGSTGGIDGTGMSYGTITAFGSVWVNGVRFNTDNTTFKFDDRGGVRQSDLRVGMVVRVDGSIDNAVANTIIVDDSIKGYVESVAADGSGIVVMGQTVNYDNLTRFDNNLRPAVGQYVEVHGLPAAGGVVAAGYVERKSALATPPFEVKGFASNHDTTARTFNIGSLVVNYAGGVADDSLPTGSWNGVLVEAKGSTCAATPACGTLTASKVEPSGTRLSSSVSVAKAEVEGVVISGTSASFVIGAQQVTTSAGTVFERGLPEDVIPGAKLEAEGPIVNGVLQAVKISFRDSIKLEGDATSVSGGTLQIAGLPGVLVRVNAQTRVKGDVSSSAALASGQHLRVKARPGASGDVVALEIDVDTRADERTILEGPVTAVNGTDSLTILGITVQPAANAQFRNLDDSAMNRAAFFAAVQPGVTLVKARGDRNGATVPWDELELED